MTGTDRYPEPEDVVRSDVPLVRNALADVAETVTVHRDFDCCQPADVDRYGYVRAPGEPTILGRVRKNTWGRSYAVWVAGENGPHLFKGNSAFPTAQAAGDALVRERAHG